MAGNGIHCLVGKPRGRRSILADRRLNGGRVGQL